MRSRVVISGRVQGVYFRDSCQQMAARYGVAGWVCNRSDGAVEAVFEGLESAVQQLVEWCRTGPRGASVTRVSVQEEPVEGLTGFYVS